MHEFYIIARYFAPLAAGFAGADGLRDDAAVLAAPEGMQIIATTDTLNEGVHFIGNEQPGEIAKKLLRVNLSDLAAKGAKPWCYLLNLGLPATCTEAWIAAFAKGLAEDQAHYGVALAGGDTTNTQTHISLSLTAFGLIPQGNITRRSGAKPGDLIYVTGTIGDGYLGLKAAQGELAEDVVYFSEKYRLPDPPVGIAPELVALASAAMDISDGLAQDLGHICAASGCGAVVQAEDVPLSDAGRRWLAQHPEGLAALLSGGDDYQLLLTLPPEHQALAEALAESWCVRLTCIGVMVPASRVEFRARDGALLEMPILGWQHHFI